jgi:hypothetical protein
VTTGALGALRFLADAATFAAAALSKAALLTVVAVERTDGGESPGLAALRAARRAADGVAATSSNARERGMIARLLAIKRKGRSRKTSTKAAGKNGREKQLNHATNRFSLRKEKQVLAAQL